MPVKAEFAAAADEMGKALAAAVEGYMTREDALAFIEKHGYVSPIEKWSSLHPTFGVTAEDVRAVLDKAMRISEQYAGTEIGSHGLLIAAKAASGRCGVSPEDDPWDKSVRLYPDAWDKAIALYQRVVDEYPGTDHARQAQWLIATCQGSWSWQFCCRDNAGKKDWARAIELYQGLHDTADSPGEQCAALRRIAEIRFFHQDWREGLAAYRSLLEEFPESPEPLALRINRTCSPFRGTDGIAVELLANTGPSNGNTLLAMLKRCNDAEEAIRLRDEFVSLVPQLDSMRSHSLLLLERRLRQLGEIDKADAVGGRIGLVDKWLVVGPLFDPEREDEDVAFGPEEDVLGGRLVLDREFVAKTKVCAQADGGGRTGTAMWIPAASITRTDTWERGKWGNCEAIGVFYAFTWTDSPGDLSGTLRLGVSGPTTVWLNGKLIASVRQEMLGEVILDMHAVPIALKAGRNELFMKFDHHVNPHSESENYARITGKNGDALQDITFSAPDVPPENVQKSDFLRTPQRPDRESGDAF